jgi:hypothetical protein
MKNRNLTVREEVHQGSEARMPRLLRWFLPNGGTLLLIAILIFTQNVWAGPILRNQLSPTALSASSKKNTDGHGFAGFARIKNQNLLPPPTSEYTIAEGKMRRWTGRIFRILSV